MTTNTHPQTIKSIRIPKKDIDLIEWDKDDMIDDVDIQIPSDDDFRELDDELLDDEGNISDKGWDALAAMDRNGDFV